jgi:acyl-coenzyme A thioesterase PaaI-like protein
VTAVEATERAVEGHGAPGSPRADQFGGPDHFVGYVGLEISHDDGKAWGRATLTPQMWATGTNRPRLGLLFTMADIVGGTPASGALTPTVDLRLRLLGTAPSEGAIVMEARPLKVGRRLWTGEVLFRREGFTEVFAISEFTFLNQKMGDMSEGQSPEPARRRAPMPLPAASFDELFQMRMLEDGTVEMDAHEAVRNGVFGTIQGGVQATMAEVVAERSLCERGSFEVIDVHVRYLNPVRAGPVVARGEVMPGDDLRPFVRASIIDGGAGGRIVSTAVMVCRPAA